MRQRDPVLLDRDVFPIDPWRLVEAGFRPEYLPLSETLFALANGYLGVRGSLDEQAPASEPGAYVNGFYETWPINYPEEAYGLPSLGQSIVALPDATEITLYVDGEPILLTRGRVLSHQRELDMRRGVLERRFEWESPSGMRIRVHTEHLVSFVHRHLAAFRFEVEVIEGEGALMIVSGLANPHAPARPPRGEEARDPRRARSLADALVTTGVEKQGQRVLLEFQTRESDLSLACGIDHLGRADAPVTVLNRNSSETAAVEYGMAAHSGTSFRLEKFAAYYTSAEEPAADPGTLTRTDLQHASQGGFDTVLEEQRAYLERFWARADVRVEGDPEVQQAIRWNIFQLAQAALRTDGQGRPREGTDRPRLRRPLLLGRRDLCPAVPAVHLSGPRAEAPGLPARHAGCRA